MRGWIYSTGGQGVRGGRSRARLFPVDGLKNRVTAKFRGRDLKAN